MKKDLAKKLRLIAAWHTPGGPTPDQPCPRKHEVCAEAADELERMARIYEQAVLGSAKMRRGLREAREHEPTPFAALSGGVDVSNTKFQPLPIPLPFAVFDEFGKGADDRVQDYAAAAVAAERVRFADELAAEITLAQRVRPNS